MKWRALLIVAVAAMVGSGRAAHAESVSLAAGSSTEFSYTAGAGVIDIFLPNVAAVGPLFLQLDGLLPRANYLVRTHLTNASGWTWTSIEAEVLNKAGVGTDAYDAPTQEPWVPAGYSASNDRDGFHFAQFGTVPRSSDVFADVFADEWDTRDFLRFSGGTVLTGGHAMLTFGLSDSTGNRPFLLALGPAGLDARIPEPATLLLIGTGLVGLTRAAQRRRRS